MRPADTGAAGPMTGETGDRTGETGDLTGETGAGSWEPGTRKGRSNRQVGPPLSCRPGQTLSVLIDVGACPGSVASSSNSTTLLMSLVVDMAMLVTRSRIASTTTGTWNS